MRIPRGWRMLKDGMRLRRGDKFWLGPPEGWVATGCAGLRIGEEGTRGCLYIRRKPKKKAPK